MKKTITAEIINPEAIEYASEKFTELLFEFYLEGIEAKEIEYSKETKKLN